MRHFLLYCKDYTNIENYSEALKDNFTGWVCHHKLELSEDGTFAYSHKDLIKLKLYYNRPPEELIFLRIREHRLLHTTAHGWSPKTKEFRKKNMPSTKGIPWSDFGLKFKEHYNMTQCDDYNLYSKEYNWFRRNGHCRWEEE